MRYWALKLFFHSFSLFLTHLASKYFLPFVHWDAPSSPVWWKVGICCLWKPCKLVAGNSCPLDMLLQFQHRACSCKKTIFGLHLCKKKKQPAHFLSPGRLPKDYRKRMSLGPFWPGIQQAMGQTSMVEQSGGCCVQSSPKLLSAPAYLLTDGLPAPNCLIPGSNPQCKPKVLLSLGVLLLHCFFSLLFLWIFEKIIVVR